MEGEGDRAVLSFNHLKFREACCTNGLSAFLTGGLVTREVRALLTPCFLIFSY